MALLGADSLDYAKELDSLKENLADMYGRSQAIDHLMAKNHGGNTYYNCIVESFGDLPIEGILTSNYFKFSELIDSRTAYLNGQLCLFEIPETLEVIDIRKRDLPNDRLYFPFIMGQSYTKPIVSRHQIQAFSEMDTILDGADILAIIGYNVNEDDNHINSFLREFLLSSRKKTIIVDKDRVSNVRKSLRLDEEVGAVEGIQMKKALIGDEKQLIWDAPELIIRRLRQKVEDL